MKKLTILSIIFFFSLPILAIGTPCPVGTASSFLYQDTMESHDTTHMKKACYIPGKPGYTIVDP